MLRLDRPRFPRSTALRVGAPETHLLAVQSNLAATYQLVGRQEDSMRLKQDVYSGFVKLHGEEHDFTLIAANNYASSLNGLRRFEEAKTFLRRTLPVARRVLGECDDTTFRFRWNYGRALYGDDCATLDDLCEAVATLDDTERIARRVLGGSNPLAIDIEKALRHARAVLRARETPQPAEDLAEEVD